jgi:hypothetical protein
MSWLEEIGTCGVPCEVPDVGEEISLAVIRGLELVSGAGSLNDSVEPVFIFMLSCVCIRIKKGEDKRVKNVTLKL